MRREVGSAGFFPVALESLGAFVTITGFLPVEVDWKAVIVGLALVAVAIAITMALLRWPPPATLSRQRSRR